MVSYTFLSCKCLVLSSFLIFDFSHSDWKRCSAWVLLLVLIFLHSLLWVCKSQLLFSLLLYFVFLFIITFICLLAYICRRKIETGYVGWSLFPLYAKHLHGLNGFITRVKFLSSMNTYKMFNFLLYITLTRLFCASLNESINYIQMLQMSQSKCMVNGFPLPGILDLENPYISMAIREVGIRSLCFCRYYWTRYISTKCVVY